MREYMESATAQQAQNTALRPSRPMEGIGNAADRVAQINGRIADLVTRFHGPMPEEATATVAPLTMSYLNDISRLHGNLDRLDNLLGMLIDAA